MNTDSDVWAIAVSAALTEKGIPHTLKISSTYIVVLVPENNKPTNNLFAYRKKHADVEAFQFTREAAAQPETWPEWLREAAKKEVPQFGAFTPHPHGAEGKWLIYGVNEDTTVQWDEYIVRNQEGILKTYHPVLFFKHYEKA